MIIMIIPSLSPKPLKNQPHFDNCDQRSFGLSYITRRLCSLDSCAAHSMNTFKMMGVRTVGTLGSQTPAKGFVHRSQEGIKS